MDKVALIKAKIERLIAEYDKWIEEQGVRRKELARLKEDFLDTISEEPASKGYDEAYLNEKIAKASKTWEGVDVDKYMDEIRGREPDKSLEEAAEKYANKEYPDEPSCGQWGTGDYEPPVDMEYPREVAKDAFIAGAKWQEGQLLKGSPLPEDTVLFQKGVEEGRRLEREDIMKDAVEKTVGQLERQWGGNIHFMHGFEVDEMDFPFLNSQECGYGDKVRIIVKEDSHE